MSRVALGSPKIEGRICPRTRVEDGGRYLGIPPKGELFSILECPGNRVRYNWSENAESDAERKPQRKLKASSD